MTGTEIERSSNGNAYSLESLGRRIKLNQQSGWGLEKGTGPQLNLLALFCQKHHLLPGDDVTLYEGKPWITVDGRVKLLRRHKDEYRGFSQRPLSNDEKTDWGWAKQDIVIETTIRTVTYGDVKAYGRVSAAEAQGTSVQGVRHNPIARVQPVEMAMKRSLARAERFAFGTESLVDDEELEDAARIVIEERNDPERTRTLSDRHKQIFDVQEDEPEPYIPTRERDVDDAKRGQEIIERAHAAAHQRDKTLDELEVERQQQSEGLL